MPQTEVSWEADASNTYAVQWSPPPGDGPWTDLGPGRAGKAYDTVGAARVYRVMETVPAAGETMVTADLLAQANPGFEDGTADWVLGAMQAVTTAEARTGGASLRSSITEIAKGALLVKNVDGVQPGETYTFSFWAKQVSAGPSYVQHYKVEWVRPDNSVTVATGNWVDFFGGDGAWRQTVSSPLTAPDDTVGARVVFYFATGAVTGATGEVLLDDASFSYQTAGAPAVAAETREIAAVARPVMRLEWNSIGGLDYRVEQSNGADFSDWSDISGPPTAQQCHIASRRGAPADFTASSVRC
jgi:hypothetical protein